LSLPFYSNLSDMNFDISKSQEKYIKKVDDICKFLRPIEDKSYLEENFNDQIIPEFKKIGMLGCPISRQYGGLGYDILTYLMALERIGAEGSSMRTFFSAHTSIGQMVLQGWGTEDQKKRYLTKTTNGDMVMGFALTEPSAGSDPSSITTQYHKEGSSYIVNGKKHWIGNGTIAGIVTTYAKDSNGKISSFVIDMDSAGIETKEIRNKIGLLSVINSEITFDSCRVPKGNLVGSEGIGLNIAYSALIDGRLSVAAGSIGVMTDCLLESISYSKSRYQHGTYIGKKQLIQKHIAKIAMAIESSRWLTYRAANARQKLFDYVEKLKVDDTNWLPKLNRRNNEYAKLRSDADRLASIAKFHASNLAFESSNISLQIFGSEGYKKTTRVARHFLDSRATIIYEGTNEVLELKIALDKLGNEYRAY